MRTTWPIEACYLESRDRYPPMRRSREEILDMFRACQATLGRAPGKEVFSKTSGLKLSEIDYYWRTFNALVQEAGARPNEFQSKLPDEVVFQDFARVCQHVGRIPTEKRAAYCPAIARDKDTHSLQKVWKQQRIPRTLSPLAAKRVPGTEAYNSVFGMELPGARGAWWRRCADDKGFLSWHPAIPACITPISGDSCSRRTSALRVERFSRSHFV